MLLLYIAALQEPSLETLNMWLARRLPSFSGPAWRWVAAPIAEEQEALHLQRFIGQMESGGVVAGEQP